MTAPVPTSYPVTITGVTDKLRTELAARGLVLIDPKDPALIERAARAQFAFDELFTDTKWTFEQVDEEIRTVYREGARAVFAALGSDPHV